MNAVLFFAHGSRDDAWRAPLDQILADFRARNVDEAALSSIAFLEFMTPNFSDAFDALIKAGATSVRVMPLFLSQGAHTRRDLAALLDAAKSKYPALKINVAPALGEVDAIRVAIVDWALGCAMVGS